MHTLPPRKRQIILRLFARGYTLTTIALRARVSLATVVRLTRVSGRRPRTQLVDDELPPGFDPDNLRRCPGCGALVYVWPCLKCQIRAATPTDH